MKTVVDFDSCTLFGGVFNSPRLTGCEYLSFYFKRRRVDYSWWLGPNLSTGISDGGVNNDDLLPDNFILRFE